MAAVGGRRSRPVDGADGGVDALRGILALAGWVSTRVAIGQGNAADVSEMRLQSFGLDALSLPGVRNGVSVGRTMANAGFVGTTQRFGRKEK